MKLSIALISIILFLGCTEKQPSNTMLGTWKLVYAETFENDSLKIKDLTKTEFIKIISNSHFAFFNQQKESSENFYSGAGTYTLSGENYIETLSYTSVSNIKNHVFPFKIKFKEDTLIQSGIEEVKDANIHRKIIEKYIKIN
ncbi:hypothetical protein N1F78_02705 [Seonamhaeicola sp. MEBiC1930]|uniref:hypothetical protein n=1 Tax=Seonamhaeicola sp. MEBiC01930 TaxID=2976768 RepID=UPI0032452015